MEKIEDIAKKINIDDKELLPYGHYMAKIKGRDYKNKGKLILVSAMTPTKSGEGKTTVSIGLADALNLLGKKTVLSLREPSLGPVFGMKGGATGGGKAMVVPSDEINLHFTGDLHAITSANNLLCAMLDNSIFQGNKLNIDPSTIAIKRCLDMNDRALREIEISKEKLAGQSPRKDGFVITAASEIMALLCLATDFEDLKRRLGNIYLAKTYDGKEIYAKDLGAVDAMASLLTYAIRPNLVQTLAGNPCIMHGGPFANIAHGCSSVIATRTALSLGKYCVTECGFGGDLGGEKFMDIVCRQFDLNPSLVVIVATVKALKLHSKTGNLEDGFANLKRHIDNFKNVYNQKVIVALNVFNDDKKEDLNQAISLCKKHNVEAKLCRQYTQGGKGCLELAKAAIKLCEGKSPTPTFPYQLSDSIKVKIEKLSSKIYGATSQEYTEVALKQIDEIEKLALGKPIIVAKTQYSFSDDPQLIGAPSSIFHIQEVEYCGGSGFVIVKAGKMTLMPGLNKEPNALKITVDKNMKIHNLR